MSKIITEDKIQKLKFEEVEELEAFYIISDNNNLFLNSKKRCAIIAKSFKFSNIVR